MFGHWLRVARTRKNMTQTELGKRIGVTGSMITQIERGSRQASPPLIKEMVRVLEVSLDFLFYGEERKRRSELPVE